MPVEIDEAVDQLLIAKWIIRILGSEYGVEVSFAPKITVRKAGSGMHIHMMLEKDGVFPAGVIENVVSKLKAFDDKGLSEKLYNRNDEISTLVRKYIHCS